MASGFIRARSSAFNDVPRRRHEPHVQRNDVARLEEFHLAAGGRVAVCTRARQRLIARPHQHLHAKRFAIARDRRADATIAKDAKRLIAQCCAHADLPLARFQCRHLLRQLTRGGENERPGQLGRGVTRNAGVLA
jgi:hypothetical protein